MGLVVEYIFNGRSFHTVSKFRKMFCTVNTGTIEKKSKKSVLFLRLSSSYVEPDPNGPASDDCFFYTYFILF
jgi:hypothetical protein